MIFEVTIPEKVSMNDIYSGMHWKKRRDLADLFHNEFLELKGKIKVIKYPVVIHYDWHFKRNALDSLNCAFMSKMLEDGMVHVGILEDDSPKYVAESRLKSQKTDIYQHDTVVISIEEV